MAKLTPRIFAMACAFTGCVTVALAELPKVFTANTVEMVAFGVYCQPRSAGRETAPGTALGYVKLYADTPKIHFEQQQVPAALGISFGVQAISLEDLPEVRMETWKPGASAPDIWHRDWYAGGLASRGYSFDFEDELILGTWRQEAWHQERQLYSVSFEVVPPEAEPKIIAFCEPAVS